MTDGPVHRDHEPTIPGGEPVPAACWMVVLRRDGAGWTSLAFEVPNAAEPHAPARFLVPMERVERDAELKLVPSLSPAERQAMEWAQPASLW